MCVCVRVRACACACAIACACVCVFAIGFSEVVGGARSSRDSVRRGVQVKAHGVRFVCDSRARTRDSGPR